MSFIVKPQHTKKFIYGYLEFWLFAFVKKGKNSFIKRTVILHSLQNNFKITLSTGNIVISDKNELLILHTKLTI